MFIRSSFSAGTTLWWFLLVSATAIPGVLFTINLLCKDFINMNIKTALQASALALAMVVAAGCSSTTKLDELSARMDRVAADASAAKSAADAAGAAASEAKQTASGAQSTANQALNAANQSQSCCDATNEKIDRMFKRSQAK
ncbi:MAG: Lpp/OprI family alanine-zipper lipoprotein [Gammaproteobacteria bacterium]